MYLDFMKGVHINIYIYIYIFVCVCRYVCTSICLHVCLSICLYIFFFFSTEQLQIPTQNEAPLISPPLITGAGQSVWGAKCHVYTHKLIA